MTSRKFDYDTFDLEMNQHIKDKKSLTGSGSPMTELMKHFLESNLNCEYEVFKENDNSPKNRRNGKTKKKVKTTYGEFELETPRDRNNEFVPEIVKKREVTLLEYFEDKIISLYSLGMTYRDISKHIEEFYGTKIHPSLLSKITDKIIPMIEEWRTRPLENTYPFVFFDALYVKVKQDFKIISKAVYCVLGINTDGEKDILGLYMSENESASFWFDIATDLKNRGVNDIFISCMDGLKGLPEAITAVFENTEIQQCIIHLIRNSRKYQKRVDYKELSEDMKTIYKAPDENTAFKNLELFEEKWHKKYPSIGKLWRNNWANISTYFKFTPEIRTVIYTTNIIESYNKQVRKNIKTKGLFPNDMAVFKLVYLTTMNIIENWKGPVASWNQVKMQLSMRYGDRIKLYK